MKLPLRKRISYQLAARSVLAALVLGLAFSAAQLANDYAEQQDRVQRSVTNILAAANKPATVAAFHLDGKLAREVIDGLFAYDFVSSVSIEDEDQTVLAGRKREAGPSRTAWITRVLGEGKKDFVVPLSAIGQQNKKIGVLSVTIDYDLALAQFYNRSLFVLLAGPLRNVVLIFVLFYAFQRFLSGPLLKLIEDFSRLDPKEGQAEELSLVGAHEDDELGMLRNAANAYVRANNLHWEERRRAEAALRESEARYRQLFESAEVAIWDQDFSEVKAEFERLRRDGVTDLREYLNESLERVQYFEKLVQTRSANTTSLKFFGAESMEVFLDRFQELFPDNMKTVFVDQLCSMWEGRDFFVAEATFKSLQGEDVAVIVSMPVPKRPEEYNHVPICVLDVTEHRSTTNALHQAQKLEAIGQLTGGVAHDFNNLLQVIAGASTMVRMGREDDDEIANWIDRIDSAVERGSSLTGQLLAFSRKQSLSVKLFAVDKVIADIGEMLQRTLGEDIEFGIDINAEDALVNADSNALQNALLNLCLNARAAMPDGGRLTIHVVPRHFDDDIELDDETLPGGEYLEISVTDDGAGMEPETVERAFDPFFTTKGVGEGTGLGLSMVYGFARQSGGFAEIESQVGEGTTVRLVLPSGTALPNMHVYKADGETAAGGTPDDAPDLGIVLVVEDDPEVRVTTQAILKRIGYAVVEAEDANKALGIIGERNDIDIVFSDVVMPGGMSGFDLAKELSERGMQHKILLTSGYPDQVIKSGELEDSNVKIIQKPYSRAELAAALQSVGT